VQATPHTFEVLKSRVVQYRVQLTRHQVVNIGNEPRDETGNFVARLLS
jgi:hypothetical protein